LWRRTIDGVVLVSRRAPGLLTLEDASADLWLALDRPMTVQEVASRLSCNHSTEAVSAAHQLLEHLAEIGFVEAGEVAEESIAGEPMVEGPR
jgi:predicted transcriptional regulator